MRVAVLVDRWAELSETFVALEAEALRDLGADVRVEALERAATPNPEAPALPVAFAGDDPRPRRLAALALLVARHPLRCAGDARTQRRLRAREPVRGLAGLAPAALRLRRARVTHLHAHFAAASGQHAMRLGALLGIPYSITAHAYDIHARPENLVEKLCGAAFATSGCAATVAELRGRVGQAAAGRIHEIVMGVRPDRLRRGDAAAPAEPGHLLAVGRLVPKKGFGVLLEALAAVPDANLTLAGDGPLAPELRARARELGLEGRVRFTGAIPPREVRAHLERAALLVVPSVVAADGDRDSMPVVAKEALAMEVPVVASALEGLPELIRPAFGRLVAPGDPAALSGAIRELLALDPDARAAMGRAGRAHVERCADVRSQTARLLELIALS